MVESQTDCHLYPAVGPHAGATEAAVDRRRRIAGGLGIVVAAGGQDLHANDGRRRSHHPAGNHSLNQPRQHHPQCIAGGSCADGSSTRDRARGFAQRL